MNKQEIIESINYCLECNNDSIPTTQKDLQTIKKALEKQIPKKPKVAECGRFGFWFICQNCGGNIAMVWDSVWQKGYYMQNYCHHCGQALDWSDNNA